MAFTQEQVQRIKAMNHDDLVANARPEDLAILVEVSLRLHRTTVLLNVVVIILTIVLVVSIGTVLHFAALLK